MFLTPYRRANELNVFNPFKAMDEFERRFFGENSIAEFKTDIREQDGSIILEADLPGFKKEDIHIDLENGCMTISAERKNESEEKDNNGNFIRRERSYGSFSRSFDTTGIDTDNIKAAFENGVLTLTMPKVTELPPSSRRLEIE